jgi:DNA-directed RNA polymerase specialized sigma24 family protein
MSPFPTTRWTLILGASQSPEAEAEAWKHLLARYWPPLYSLFRAKGLDAASAEDAVQGLAAELLERDVLKRLSPERGRLRGFLKVAAENHLMRSYERAAAEKRGGGVRPIELDAALGERLAGPAPSPELAFERAWALAVFDRALVALEGEWHGRAGDFEVLRRFFSPERETPAYRDAAAEFGLTVPQLKSMLHRARLRFRELVEAEVRETVQADRDVNEEVASLLEALAS